MPPRKSWPCGDTAFSSRRVTSLRVRLRWNGSLVEGRRRVSRRTCSTWRHSIRSATMQSGCHLHKARLHCPQRRGPHRRACTPPYGGRHRGVPAGPYHRPHAPHGPPPPPSRPAFTDHRRHIDIACTPDPRGRGGLQVPRPQSRLGLSSRSGIQERQACPTLVYPGMGETLWRQGMACRCGGLRVRASDGSPVTRGMTRLLLKYIIPRHHLRQPSERLRPLKLIGRRMTWMRRAGLDTDRRNVLPPSADASDQTELADFWKLASRWIGLCFDEV